MKHAPHALITATVALALLAGCGGDAPAAPAPNDPTDAASSSAADATITVAIGGDVHFAERTLDLLDDPDSAFGPIAELYTAADHAVVNLETPVTDRGTAEPKQWLFKAPPEAMTALTAAGIDLVSLANNHALDYGQVGLSDTFDHAEAAGLPVVGAGQDREQALAAHLVTIENTTIAYVAVSAVWELWDTWMAQPDRPGIAHIAHDDLVVAAVEAAADAADVVIVLPHWGTESQACPDDEQFEWASRLADAGADAIVGTHAHLLQGNGYLGDTYVAYGMGNHLWWWNDAASNDTGVVELTIEDKKLTGARFVPATIDRTTGQPIPATGSDADRILGELDELRDCAKLSADPG